MPNKKEKFSDHFYGESVRSLFNAIEEGFCMIEVLFDKKGEPCDYLFLETNEAFENQTGLHEVVGKRMRDLVPDQEQYWFDIYGRVAQTGKSERFERRIKKFDHLYEVHAFKIGAPKESIVAVLFKDIMKREQQERRQNYILKLSDNLRSLSDSEIIQQTATFILGKELNVTRVFYMKTIPTTHPAHFIHIIKNDYQNNSSYKSLGGRQLLHTEENLHAELAKGQNFIVTSIDKLSEKTKKYKESFKSIGVCSFIVVPIIKKNQYVAAMFIGDQCRREWKREEIMLVEETAERTWEASKRGEAEKKWQESKSHLNEAIQAAKMGSWRADLLKGRVTRDAHLNKLFGNDAEETSLKLKDCFADVYEGDRQAVKTAWQKAIKTHGIFSAEYRVIHKDGSVHWMIGEGRFLQDKVKGENQNIFTGLTSEITQQKRMEETLGHYEAQHKLLIEQADDFAIIFLDVEGIITDWNKGAEKIFGWEKEEIIGKSGHLLFTLQDRKDNIPEFEMKKSKKSGRANDQRWMLRKDNAQFWANGTMHSLKDEKGQLSGLFKILRDETARKVTEEALYKSEENYRVIVNQTIVGVLKVDLSGNIIFANNHITKMLGYEIDEILNKNVMSLIHEEDQSRNAKMFNRLKKKGKAYEMEKRLYRKKGTFLWVNNQISPIFEKEKDTPSSAVIISVNISKQKALEKQKDEFISLASHELKTPLTGIKAYAELLQEALGKEYKSSVVNLARNLNTQVDRLNNLVYELLDTTRISNGKLTLKREYFDLNKLVQHLGEELQLTAPDHKLIVETEKIDFLYADKERITQVLTNLITNAVKYSPQGCEVIISTKDINKEKVKVSVRDFGEGLEPGEQEKIFMRFFRRKETKNISGFGLGLYISTEIIKKHGGTIKVESPVVQEEKIAGLREKQKNGSLFYFILSYGR